MDIFIAVLIDYTCIAKLIALAKSTAILEKTTLATIHPLGQRRDCCVEVCLISINEEEGDVWSLIWSLSRWRPRYWLRLGLSLAPPRIYLYSITISNLHTWRYISNERCQMQNSLPDNCSPVSLSPPALCPCQHKSLIRGGGRRGAEASSCWQSSGQLEPFWRIAMTSSRHEKYSHYIFWPWYVLCGEGGHDWSGG